MRTRPIEPGRRAGFGRAAMVVLFVLWPPTWFGGSPIQTAHAQCVPGWSPVGTQNDDPHTIVANLVVFDDGSGPALYVGGAFESIAGVAAHNLAKWDGRHWSEVGGGVSDRK